MAAARLLGLGKNAQLGRRLPPRRQTRRRMASWQITQDPGEQQVRRSRQNLQRLQIGQRAQGSSDALRAGDHARSLVATACKIPR